jgi:predicted negative regulator of RcsB-dependent stress response
MRQNLPVILIEVVLIFGGVLAFGWWQLRSLKKDREQTARERAEREAATRSANPKEPSDAAP